MRFVRNIFSLGSTVLLSRLTGMLRDIAMAFILGAGLYADAFVLAWRLPSILRSVFADGAYRLVIPILADKIEGDDISKSESLRNTARLLLGWITIITICVTVIFEIFMPYFIELIAPGLSQDSQRLQAAITMGRIMFPYLPLISITMFLLCLRNLNRKFAATGLLQIIFNIILIFVMSVLFLLDSTSATIMLALGYAVLATGLLQIIFVAILLAKDNLLLWPGWPYWQNDIKQFLLRLNPLALQSLLVYAIIITDTYIISGVTGSISAYHYAERFMQLPIGVVALSVGLVLLPELARAISANNPDKKTAQKNIDNKSNHALLLCLVFIMPAFVVLMLYSEEIITLVYARGSFSLSAIQSSSAILFGLSFSLPFLACEPVFIQNCYARKIVSIPLIASVISFIVNLIGDLVLFPLYGLMGVAFATGVASAVRLLFYAIIFWRRRFFHLKRKTLFDIGVIILASVLMGLCIYYVSFLQLGFYNFSAYLNLFLQISLSITLGIIVYITVIFCLIGFNRFYRDHSF